jgi:hypothetical protein
VVATWLRDHKKRKGKKPRLVQARTVLKTNASLSSHDIVSGGKNVSK